MNFSSPTLHAPVLRSQAHKDLLSARLSSVAAARQRAVLQRSSIPGPPAPINIPLTTVSLAQNFDAYIHISYRGAAAGYFDSVVVDSGNFSLIVPDYAKIAASDGFATNYRVLEDNVTEPWGCPAKLLQGPVEIVTQSGSIYEIADCVFYACTGPNANNERTANFGTGCISPLQRAGDITLQSPLSFDKNYSFAEFKYAPANTIFAASSDPNFAEGSLLILYNSMPCGYQTFEIIKDLMWMSLSARALSIGGVQTGWPGSVSSPIAMVDTGGGPVFLSDPNNYLYSKQWPDPVTPPWWTSPGSVSCISTKDNITVSVGDNSGTFSYEIDTAVLPAPVQGLTLVMCGTCEYMMGNQGMNIGGISALFNCILIDYAAAKVGFKPKTQSLV
jgi:hypothetical protein